jgi:hypothetical protein
MDDSRDLYIREIIKKSNYNVDMDTFWDMIYEDDEKDKERSKENMLKNQDSEYLAKLEKAVKSYLVFSPTKQRKVLKKIEILEFPVRIGYIDKFLKQSTDPLIKLTLNSTFLTANECLILSQNP